MMKKHQVKKISIGTVPSPKPPLDSNATFAINGQTHEVNASNLKNIGPLGQGAYGYVQKMKHKPTEMVMAVKRIHFTTDLSNEEQLLRELDVSMRSANCPYVVHFYGAFFTEGDVWICMEVMDVSLLDFYRKVYEDGRTVPENIIGVVTLSVLRALHYLHSELRVIHRDVKPSNILLNRKGQVKICDFGISGVLVNSYASTITGCENYLAPERVVPNENDYKYNVTSDVWSLGITLVEVATGKYPYGKWKTMFEQISEVVKGDPPRLPSGQFTPEFEDFVSVCLQKDPKSRPKYAQLLNHEFIEPVAASQPDISPFVTEIVDQLATSTSPPSTNLN